MLETVESVEALVTVYLVTGRKTLHKAVRQNGILLTAEADNLDTAKATEYTDLGDAQEAARHSCRRGWPATAGVSPAEA